jgi:hypothetical protein
MALEMKLRQNVHLLGTLEWENMDITLNILFTGTITKKIVFNRDL